MPLKVKAHDLVHETGARKGTAIPVRGEARTLGLKADYRNFEKDCGVSREHCTVRSPDKHASLWVEDRLSRKGTYVCIGGAGKSCETFPVFPDVCLRLSKSNFYFAAPPERGREESSSEEESDEDEDDESDVSLSDDDDTVHGEVDHRLLVKFRGPQTKRQRRVVLTGSTTIGSSDECDIVVGDDDEMAPLHCSVELDKDKGVFFVKPHDTSSGTYVKLAEKTSFELNQGDILRLGDARLSVRKTEAWAVSGWLDSMLLKLALCLLKVEDGHRERLKPLGATCVWNRFRAYRKRSGKRHDPPVGERGWRAAAC